MVSSSRRRARPRRRAAAHPGAQTSRAVLRRAPTRDHRANMPRTCCAGNWYQVKDAERVYAVARLQDNRQIGRKTMRGVSLRAQSKAVVQVERRLGSHRHAAAIGLVGGHWHAGSKPLRRSSHSSPLRRLSFDRSPAHRRAAIPSCGARAPISRTTSATRSSRSWPISSRRIRCRPGCCATRLERRRACEARLRPRRATRR